MSPLPDFPISPAGIISNCFLHRGIISFAGAAAYINSLPYGRNADKEKLETVFTDNRGTCSTKHALLKQLAVENGFEDLQLILGIFRMNAANTPKIAGILKKYNLSYIPEAHNYLKYKGDILDFTFAGSSTFGAEDELLSETVIAPEQITAYKIARHQSFLKEWLEQETGIPYTPGELWNIREACIAALSA